MYYRSVWQTLYITSWQPFDVMPPLRQVSLMSLYAVTSLCVLVGMTQSEVITSLDRIRDMVLLEENILNNVESLLYPNQTLDDRFQRFHHDRLSRLRSRNASEACRLLHPNSIFSLVESYADDYRPLHQQAQAWPPLAQTELLRFADDDDYKKAIESLLRLQEVYGLRAADMVQGLYLGHAGPPLTVTGAYSCAKTAMHEGKIPLAIEWLQATLDLHNQRRVKRSEFDMTLQNVATTAQAEAVTITKILSLLGRCLLRVPKVPKATELLQPAEPQDLHLLSPPAKHIQQMITEDRAAFSKLCVLQHHVPGSGVDSRLFCRYRPIRRFSYSRYREEIISWSPFVSRFYNVITDKMADDVKATAKHMMLPSKVKVGKTYETNTTLRSGNTAFFDDYESPVAHEISRIVSHITGLDAEGVSGSQKSGERLQVVNYGMGGHYVPHYDPFRDSEVENSGNRLATFLFYLTDVGRGGSTAFIDVGAVITPVKNSAVFWYNFKTNGERDDETWHASCPVLVGEKWICNKWINTYGNTFTRRCGLTDSTTQRDIERDMRQ